VAGFPEHPAVFIPNKRPISAKYAVFPEAPMKKCLLFTISIYVIISILASSLYFLAGCGKSDISADWQNLREDEEWTQSLNQYLSLAYTEQGNIAAFTSLSPKSLSPSLYTTYAIVRMFKSIGQSIENQDRIAKYIDSLMNEEGAYLDSLRPSFRPDYETMQAITVLSELGFQSQNTNLVIDYLLSLRYDDGTFLINPEEGVTSSETTKLERISLGTTSVVMSLIMLGYPDKIPQETKDFIAAAISSALGENGPFPTMTYDNNGSITNAIELLTRIDPNLVSERAREYIIYALSELVKMPVHTYLFPATANRLLDIAELIGLYEATQNNVLEKIRVYLKEQVFPLQNRSGGFGSPETIEPLTTGENVILANRLGVEYPNFNKLMSVIDMHWVENGWAPFLEIQINNSSYIFTYYAIEVTKFSGFDDYDREKVARFLKGSYSSNAEGSLAPATLEEIYYAVLGIKAMNEDLSQDDRNNIKEIILKSIEDLQGVSITDVNSQFTYALRISQEAGFDLPEDVETELLRLNGIYKEKLFEGEKTVLPQSLYDLWQAVEDNGPVFTRDEIQDYLRGLYDEESGGYYSMMISSSQETFEEGNNSIPKYELHPEIAQTYYAVRLLSDIGETLPDRNKTINFVLECKQKYGFSRAPDLHDINIIATFSALMILKHL
jgi:hypothetical protein